LFEGVAIHESAPMEGSFQFIRAAVYHPYHGISPKICSLPQFIVGIENSAPSFTPEGQRAVTVLVLV
jgi:hypothetical protein